MLPQHMTPTSFKPEWTSKQQAMVYIDFVPFWSVLVLHCRARVPWRRLLPPPRLPMSP